MAAGSEKKLICGPEEENVVAHGHLPSLPRQGGFGSLHWAPFMERKRDLIHQNSSGKEYGRKSDTTTHLHEISQKSIHFIATGGRLLQL